MNTIFEFLKFLPKYSRKKNHLTFRWIRNQKHWGAIMAGPPGCNPALINHAYEKIYQSRRKFFQSFLPIKLNGTRRIDDLKSTGTSDSLNIFSPPSLTKFESTSITTRWLHYTIFGFSFHFPESACTSQTSQFRYVRNFKYAYNYNVIWLVYTPTASL